MPSVLIVDDSLLIRRELERFLSECNFQIVGPGKDGVEGVQLYKTHRPDLVTLDLTMPNKDGIEALSEIVAHDPNARVIVISAIHEEAKVKQALKLGARSYIYKPLQLKSTDYIQRMKDAIDNAMAA